MQSGTHPSEKRLMAELFCNDSVSDNDTPVLPTGGRLREILAGVRVPWSGSQPPSQVFAPASGEVVSNTDVNETYPSLNVRCNRDRPCNMVIQAFTPLKPTSLCSHSEKV